MKWQTRRLAYVFRQYLSQRLAKQVPREHLKILLDIARPRLGELHDALEEPLKTVLMFRHGHRAKTLQIAPDAILLFDGKFVVSELLEEVYDIDGGRKEFLGFPTIDTRNDGVGFLVVFLHEGFAGDEEVSTLLEFVELDESPPLGELFVAPSRAHGFKGGDQPENRGRIIVTVTACTIRSFTAAVELRSANGCR